MPDGTSYSYTYDKNELRTIRIPGAGNITYPSYTMGRPDDVIFPGGTRSYGYDALARTTNITAPGMNYSYPDYDKVGNILTKATEHGNYGYDYDDLYRLTDANNPTLDNETYSYDPVGNRLTASGVTGTIDHNANNELRLYGDISFDYDANGNMTHKTSASESWVYGYNVQNRLVRVEEDDLLIAEYGYDPFGRRLWKEVDGERTYFLYSDEGLIAEYDESGNEIRSYGYRPDSMWGTDPLWLQENGQYYWYQNDHLGTPQKLIDSAGTVVWSATYSAFGEAQIEVETMTNNLRFPGQYYDVETGLHYNYHRYYNPKTGRYTKVDLLGFAGGDVNLYAYVWNSPGNWIDPSGLVVVLVFDVEDQTLHVYDVDKNNRPIESTDYWAEVPVFSGKGDQNDQHINDYGPIPKGEYKIGKPIQKSECVEDHPDGDCTWYPLYGKDGMGGWTAYGIPVKNLETGLYEDPVTGKRYYRGGMYLHVGLASGGCLTVASDVPYGEGPGDPYPTGEVFDKIKDMLDNTKTHLPDGCGKDGKDTCPGYLFVE